MVWLMNQALRLGKLGEQTVVISPKGFLRLKFVDAYTVDKTVYYPRFLDRDVNARETYRKEMKKGKSYRDDIFERVPLSRIISMYPVYHEMDITNFITTMEEFYHEVEREPNLKRIRENRGLSQMELAEQSGVNLRNIQMYEQRKNDIDKAQAGILYKRSRVLGCNIEDLLESPMM